MEDKQQLILYQLYEQFIFLCTLYADTIEVDLSAINNEYTIALLEAILDEGEITETTLEEYNHLAPYRGVLNECGGNGQANVDAVLNRIIEIQNLVGD